MALLAAAAPFVIGHLHVARAAVYPLATALSAAGALALAGVLTWLNQRGARRLQRDIDALGV